MNPEHILWVAHVIELAGSNCTMDMEIGRVWIGRDEDLAAAAIWKDRNLTVVLPSSVGQVPKEVPAGMYAPAADLIRWIQEANETPVLNGRWLLDALLRRLEHERLECERGACLVYLKMFP